VNEIIRIIEAIRDKQNPEYQTTMLTPNILIRTSTLRSDKGGGKGTDKED
jgi:hypothetical protein